MLIYIIATGLMLSAAAWLYPKHVAENGRNGKQGDLSAEPGGFFHTKTGKKLILSVAVSMLPLLMVSSVRWNVGVDTWHTYTPEYLAMKSESLPLTAEEEEILKTCYQLLRRLDFDHTKEEAVSKGTLEEAYRATRDGYHHTGIGFQLLQRLLIFLHADVQWLYFVTSFIILGFIFSAIWVESKFPVLCCLFFVITGNFFLSMNIVSQFIGIAICLYACRYAQEQKGIRFILLVGVAATFHISALVFLPVYFFPKLKIKPLWCAVAVAAGLVIAQFLFPVVEKLVAIAAPKYSRHFALSSEFEWVFFAIGCAVFVLSTIYYADGKDLPYFRIWYYANVFGLIALCFSGNIPLMKRINYYFAAPHFLLIPMVISLEKQAFRRKMLYIVIIGLFAAETFVAIGLMNKHAVLPYTAFFQGDRMVMTQALLDHIPGLW